LKRITGPHGSYFIAAQALRIGDSWLGEARVFTKRPSDFDDADSVAKLAGDLGNANSDLMRFKTPSALHASG
jgi:hypothetical protein